MVEYEGHRIRHSEGTKRGRQAGQEDGKGRVVESGKGQREQAMGRIGGGCERVGEGTAGCGEIRYTP